MSDLMSDSEFENFSSPNVSKFAVECDWSSKISQIRAKIGFYEKKICFFFNKKLNFFFKIEKGGKFTLKCVSNDIISK